MAEIDTCLMCGDPILVGVGPQGSVVPDFCGACYSEMQPRAIGPAPAETLGEAALAVVRAWRTRRSVG